MKWFSGARFRKWLILPPIMFGVVVVVLLRLNKSDLKPAAPPEAVRVLRFVRVAVVDVVPRVIGYGTAEPRRVWQAVAEVKGRVVRTHPQLESGAMVKRGEVLVVIDRKEYELVIARLEADIEQVSAQLEELSVQQANDQTLVQIETSSLELAKAELQRLKSLRDMRSVSESSVDNQRRLVLAQERNVQNLKNSLRLLPQQRKSLEAALAVKRANLEQAKLDLEKTTIAAPFDCRLSDVSIEVDQFVATGQLLFEAHGTDVTEVEAQIPLDRLRNLISSEQRVVVPVNLDAGTVRRLFNFQVIVRYRIGDFEAQWEGSVVRMREQIEPRTHAIGLVVAVEKPYHQAIPGQRPPLVQGMFCEVELRGTVRKDRVVIPRLALHGKHVYVLDDEDRLRRRTVVVVFDQAGFACLGSGLRGGERVVVSDPTPAIEGMRVVPVEDGALARRIMAEARGEGTVK